MLKWLNRILAALLWRFIERKMLKLFDVGDYESALRHATHLCRQRENNIIAQHWRALALLGLEQYQEALDIANRLERLKAEGVMNIADPWVIEFEETKCRALYGLNQYGALHKFASNCLERHPGTVSLAVYQLLATMQLGKLIASKPCLQFLDGSIDNLDEPWHFFVLYSAQRHLGNTERAGQIARLALAKYPDDAGVREMAKSKCATPDSVSPRIPSCHFRHFRHGR